MSLTAEEIKNNWNKLLNVIDKESKKYKCLTCNHEFDE